MEEEEEEKNFLVNIYFLFCSLLLQIIVKASVCYCIYAKHT